MVIKNEALAAVAISAKMRRAPKARIHFDEVVRARAPIRHLIAALGASEGDPLAPSAAWIAQHDPKGAPEAAVMVAGSMMLFAAWGEQTFLVGPQVQNLFQRSALADFRFRDLQLPYGTFFVALPEPTRGEATTTPRVQGFYVSGTYVNDTLTQIVLALWQDTPGMASPYGGIFHALGLVAEEAGDMSLSDQVERVLRGSSWGIAQYGPVLTTLLALLLYLQSEHPEVEETAESAQQRTNSSKPLPSFTKARLGKTKKAKRAPTRAITPLRRRVLWVAPTLEECQEAAEGAAGPRRRHWVRGHFKRVRSPAAEPVVRWILPYERCKTSLIQALPRTYTIPEED